MTAQLAFSTVLNSEETQPFTDRLVDLVQGLNAIVWEMNALSWEFTFVSDRAEDILGYPISQWFDEPGFWHERLLHPEDRDWCVNVCMSATYEARDHELQYRAIAADGRVVWLKNVVRVTKDENGRAKLLRGVMLEITKEKEAEAQTQQLSRERAASIEVETVQEALRKSEQRYRSLVGKVYGIMTHAVEVTEQVRARQEIEKKAEELARLTEALERSNKELDQFAYVASHDLKAPLRAIANLSEWIEEDLADKLTDESREHMNLMRKRVHRMAALIDGILHYSSAGRVQQVERVNVSAMLSEVIELLAPPPFVLIVIDPGMPTLKTEKIPLEQIFMNLIGNAIKYTQCPDARVQVSVREVGRYYEFAIADNGPGIAPEYHQKIWGIFQRLEARDQVEGTGVGLSIVKKIVESRGGRVRLESEVGAGATFYFTWPKQSQSRFNS